MQKNNATFRQMSPGVILILNIVYCYNKNKENKHQCIYSYIQLPVFYSQLAPRSLIYHLSHCIFGSLSTLLHNGTEIVYNKRYLYYNTLKLCPFIYNKQEFPISCQMVCTNQDGGDDDGGGCQGNETIDPRSKQRSK